MAGSATEVQCLPTITKKELNLMVGCQVSCKKNLAAKIVDSLFNTMHEQLIEDHRIEILGFGVFRGKATRLKPAARNPCTGEIIYVLARRNTHFKLGRLLKDALHQTRDLKAGELAALELESRVVSPNRDDHSALCAIEWMMDS